MIAAGRLDRTITIRRETETVTATGAVTKTWADLATVRAEVVENVFAENFTAYGTAENGTVVFRIRYRADITTADRVFYAGRTFDLKEVVEIGRRAGLELKGISTK
jgi:SPP1 family predicted phage head-tail adaptor